ncbi:unnamed protein product [Didymodactylos carnosus]|uniref:Uncharacterized protein n=1 Tax=Didymodactylos carnosus TaxID=1234261 RepID=A0A814EZ78_9BILA|nr:unnamed protein product [Didymodactylos carnosus]CAF0975966.1 unnamed protein product [Didymodactylos carnosus]CAF3543210.1 unnamed protein product [Didymodactylos carnosus]CAF3748827.1 unnamed protein product [Didymodactylos carnosus]
MSSDPSTTVTSTSTTTTTTSDSKPSSLPAPKTTTNYSKWTKIMDEFSSDEEEDLYKKYGPGMPEDKWKKPKKPKPAVKEEKPTSKPEEKKK